MMKREKQFFYVAMTTVFLIFEYQTNDIYVFEGSATQQYICGVISVSLKIFTDFIANQLLISSINSSYQHVEGMTLLAIRCHCYL